MEASTFIALLLKAVMRCLETSYYSPTALRRMNRDCYMIATVLYMLSEEEEECLSTEKGGLYSIALSTCTRPTFFFFLFDQLSKSANRSAFQACGTDLNCANVKELLER